MSLRSDASDAASQRDDSNAPADPNRRLVCPLCPYATRTAKTIEDHLSSGHANPPKTYRCPECSYSASTEFFVREHYKWHCTPQPPTDDDASSTSTAREFFAEPQRPVLRRSTRPRDESTIPYKLRDRTPRIVDMGRQLRPRTAAKAQGSDATPKPKKKRVRRKPVKKQGNGVKACTIGVAPSRAVPRLFPWPPRDTTSRLGMKVFFVWLSAEEKAGLRLMEPECFSEAMKRFM